MSRRRFTLSIAVVVAMLAHNAFGDIYHVQSPSTLKTDGGSTLKLPPGYFMDEDTWKLRDTELKGLQEQSTRLRAENQSLRNSAVDHPWLLAGISAVGTALGLYLALR